MYRIFRFRSQINKTFPHIILINRSHLLKTTNYSNIPGKFFFLHLFKIKIMIHVFSMVVNVHFCCFYSLLESLQTKNLTKTKQFKRNVKRFAEVVQGQYFVYVYLLIYLHIKII